MFMYPVIKQQNVDQKLVSFAMTSVVSGGEEVVRTKGWANKLPKIFILHSEREILDQLLDCNIYDDFTVDYIPCIFSDYMLFCQYMSVYEDSGMCSFSLD